MFAQNVSYVDILKGTYKYSGNDILIQILDPNSDFEFDFPKPIHEFNETYQFRFADITYDRMDTDEWKNRITNSQAKELIDIIISALENHQNITVHCMAGLCRSGAVVEIASMLGYDAIGVLGETRRPNPHIKSKLLQALLNRNKKGDKERLPTELLELMTTNPDIFLPWKL